MPVLPLLNVGDIILPWLVVMGVAYAVLIGFFLTGKDETKLKAVNAYMMGVNVLCVGGVLAYMAVSTASVCLSGQATTPAAVRILQNCQKSGWAYLLLMGFIGLTGLFFMWIGAAFFRPAKFTPPDND